MLPKKLHKLITLFGLCAIFVFIVIVAKITDVRAVEGVQLLPAPWVLSGENGASEKYQDVSPRILSGHKTLSLTYNLHGACLLDGDASAIIFDQAGQWKFVSLSRYGKNCLNGEQTVQIPLSHFGGLDTNLAVSTFHSRIWLDKPFKVEIKSAVLSGATQVTPIPAPTSVANTYPTNTFQGQYFDNRTLSGAPKLVRNDSQIDFSWYQNSPDASIPTDIFSARWGKKAYFTAGRYRFSVTADDGIRVFIDNRKIIDRWKDQAATTYSVDWSITEGYHTITVEYYENFGMSVAKFSYAKLSSSLPTSSPKPTLSPTPTPTTIPTPAPVGASWTIQSVSSMKESKDRVCSQRDAAWIASWVAKAKNLGANYVAVETPYDNPACASSVEYTDRWVKAIRAAGLRVWHRHMPLAFESIYDTPKQKSDFFNMISSYIKNNPSFFQAGDIFTPIPEPQNGGVGGVTGCNGLCQFDNAAAFNKWLRDAMDVSENAFSSIGLGGKMKIGYYGFDGFVAWGHNNPDWNGILEDATIAKMGNLTIDHYPQLVGTSMKEDLDELQARYPNVPIIFGEWGTVGTENKEQQVLENMSQAKRPGVVGFNYWHMGVGGNESLINENFSQNEQYDEVQSYFKGTR